MFVLSIGINWLTLVIKITKKEYVEFKVKYIDKLKDIKQDFDKLSEDNKIRIMLEFKQILPVALFNFEAELKKYK